MKNNDVYQLFIAIGIFFLLGTLVVGCRPQKVTVYTISRSQALAEQKIPTMSPGHHVDWSVPDSWEERPAKGVRKASYIVKNIPESVLSISVITFPGDAGGILNNINRWRGQVGLERLDMFSENHFQNIRSIGDHKIWVVSYASPSDQKEQKHIMGAIFPLETETWFFKMMGSSARVEKESIHFTALINSIELK